MARKLSDNIRKAYQENGPECKIVDKEIRNLSDYFGLLDALLTSEDAFWFRGHSDLKYDLTPSALRYTQLDDRGKAINALADFKRYAEIKIDRPPRSNENLKWLQLAQHYGLGTRLLDWTENAAAALYFACSRHDTDGNVFVLNPIELNISVDGKRPRVFDAETDRDTIEPYLALDGKQNRRGLRTIAIHPVLNSSRIVLQKGVFTLHGNRRFGLDHKQASSLLKLPILSKYKPQILLELDRVGINETTLFPELEHLCRYLRRRARLG